MPWPLCTTVRRARSKYTGQYRRGAAERVSTAGGRGKAFGKNQRARDKAEVFEDALARVSRRLAALAKQSAADLKAERLAAAAAAKAGQKPEAELPAPPTVSPKKRDAALRSTRTTKRRADTRAQGARRQAKRDAKG